ncbi:MAG: c-type cytochrome [Psychrobacter sp.]|nr:c-type cytochrome [Psychrobacter sp.]
MNSMQTLISKSSVAKLVFGLSALLMISACSDNTATDDNAAVEPVETTVVEEPVIAEPVEETVVAIEAPADEVATIEAPADEVATIEADTNSSAEPEVLATDAGVKLYESNCKVCHTNGLLNAPKIDDKPAWTPRIAKGKETLYMHSAQGFNKMPAQAVNGITEAQVKASVDYMLAAVS